MAELGTSGKLKNEAEKRMLQMLRNGKPHKAERYSREVGVPVPHHLFNRTAAAVAAT